MSFNTPLTDAILKATKTTSINPVPPENVSTTPSVSSGQIVIGKENVPQEIDFKAVPITKSSLSGKNLILTPYLKAPLKERTTALPNTYLPNSKRIFEVINCMDEAIHENPYFLDLEDKWHPFISRLYISSLWFIQITRAQIASGTITPKHFQYYDSLIKIIPLESLPVPGPIAPIIKSLAVATPASSRFGKISPSLPEVMAIENPSEICTEAVANSAQLLHPHIPALNYFINLIRVADDGNIPDFSDPSTFDNTEQHVIYGVDYAAEEWDQRLRNMYASQFKKSFQ